MVLTDLVGVKKRGYYQSMNYVNFGSASAYISQPLTFVTFWHTAVSCAYFCL